jgi:glutamate synthase domain-containing protein 2
MGWIVFIGVVVGALVLLAIYDLTQRKHAILRNFPIIGHFRYGLESIGPELRQYIVTDNDEERPFTRDQRRWIYTTAKRENPYFGFGTDNRIETIPDYVLIRHAPFPHAAGNAHHESIAMPSAKVLGEWRGRPGAFRPNSLVNVSGMSFGSLSGPAVEALNRGCGIAGCLHNTGEGGISIHHRHGGDLIWQIGTGYFGCRAEGGGFDMGLFEQVAASREVKAIEIKLSQGAKPGLGGVLPGKKVTVEIAAARGVPAGETVMSPNQHSTFRDVASMVDWIEALAGVSGLPVGIKSAVGQAAFWDDLAAHMAATGRGPDFIAIDGGEGGTGAGPLVFTDHVALPFRLAMASVFGAFARHGMAEKVTFIGSGKLGFPEQAVVALALGADMINVGREAMMAVGCIQAQRCHNGHCPTGVATQNRWLTRGLDPLDKGERLAGYIDALRADLARVAWACGVAHPSLIPADAVDLLISPDRSESLLDHFGYRREWRGLSDADASEIASIMG